MNETITANEPFILEQNGVERPVQKSADYAAANKANRER